MQTETIESTENFTLFECFDIIYAIRTEVVRENIAITDADVSGIAPFFRADYSRGMVKVRGRIIGAFDFRKMIDPQRCVSENQKLSREFGAILMLEEKVTMLIFDSIKRVVIVNSDDIYDNSLDVTGLISRVAHITTDEMDSSGIMVKKENTVFIIDDKKLAEILKL